MIHEDIFFPSGKEELEGMLGSKEKKEEHKAFIVPHMELRRVSGLYREVFSHIPDGTPITLLLPLHREKLLRDEGCLAFSPDKDYLDTPSGRIRLSRTPFPSSSAYESEEYTAELFAVCSAYFCPSSPLRIIFSPVKKSGEVKKLVSLLKDFCDNNEAYAVSSNLTEELRGTDLKTEEREAIAILESGEMLLDLINKGRFKACGGTLIEAVSRLVPGKWKLIGTAEDEKYAAHAAFYRE